VVAPSGCPARDRYQAGLAILAKRYRIVYAHAPLSLEARPHPYLAAGDASRADELNQVLRDPEVEAIFAARGGYGASRILPLLDGDAFLRRRPLLCGFSDITALHGWAARLGVPTVHGPVVTQLASLPEAELGSLYDLLEGRALPALEDLEAVAPGRARGPLLGGNLSILAHLCGTPYLPDLAGALLLLEEIGEQPYRIDRMLAQLELAGVLADLAGVIVGSLCACEAPQGPEAVPWTGRQVVLDRLRGLGVPVAIGAPVGHADHNLALLLGVEGTLEVGEVRGTLRFERG
jgi:muramoyltetrapeptide carboxypeptidase